MKQMYHLIALLLTAAMLHAQTATTNMTELDVNERLTTSIIFPEVVSAVDRGTPDVLVKRVKDHPNILLVKAGRDHFPATNMTVVTAAGRLYAFAVQYDPDPSVTAIRIGARSSFMDQIAARKRMPFHLAQRRYGMVLRLDGIYIDRNLLYFQVEADNRTALPYQADRLRFFICDRTKGKRTAVQDLEQVPLQVDAATPVIAGNATDMMVAVFPEFTIADNKVLVLELTEAGGGRLLRLKIPEKALLRARQLP